LSVPRKEPLGAAPSPTGWRRWTGFALVYCALSLFFAGYAAVELKRHPIGAVQACAIYVCLSMLLALYLAPGFSVSRAWLIERLHGVRAARVYLALFLTPYLVYAAGTGDFREMAFARLAAIAAPPFVLFAVRPVRRPRQINWQDALVLLWLVTPVFAGQIGGIWNVPVNLDFMARLFLVGVGSWSFLIFRRISDSGYDFRFSRETLSDAFRNLGGFTVIGLPLGFMLRFIAWHPQWRGAPAFVADFLGLFLFVALAEELFFRGLLQNLLEGSFRSRYGAQAVTAILFGLSHIRHAPFPNWRYVALATIAGWFYGAAYRKHRSLMASATTHALVDTLWRTFLTLPKG
jgi:membrane protease YdiL (CAAX protease family)